MPGPNEGQGTRVSGLVRGPPRGPALRVLHRLALRAVAALLAAGAVALVGLAVARFLSAEPHESWQRLVARLCLAFMILAGAPSLWRLPDKLPARRRRRLHELVSVMARPELLQDWQETSPSVKVLEALLDDYREARAACRREDVAALLHEDEARDLDALDAEIARQIPGLPMQADLASQFQDLPGWQAIRARAAHVLDGLTARALS